MIFFYGNHTEFAKKKNEMQIEKKHNLVSLKDRIIYFASINS